MAKLRRGISNRMVAALRADKDTLFWDRELIGFGVRVHTSGAKVYVAQARGSHGPRRITVGRHGVIHADEARRRAALIIARIKAGDDPVTEPVAAKFANGPTVADLAARYMSQHIKERCKPKTQESRCSLLGLHVLPAFGKIPLAAMNRERVVAFHERLVERPTTANMAVRMLSHMFVLAESWGMVADGFNPCRGVPKYPVRRRERFLTDAEFERLGRVLDEAEAGGIASASAIAALRLLMLTGCRKGEILTLKWEDVDLEGSEIRLPDSKTGPRSVALGPDAVRVLEAIPRRADDPWVLAGKRAGTHLRTLDSAWARLRARAGLSDVRIHDLRHSFASRALALGESLPMIARLLGHREIETTARYAHLDRASVHEAAARIAGRIAEDIL